MIIDVDTNKKFKTFMIINESFKCPANCPFCTAKITKWEKTNHDWNNLGEKLKFLYSRNMKFENITISGNGEPALIGTNTLEYIIFEYRKYNDMFDYARFQSCGEIFLHEDKWNLVKDFNFEITRLYVDPIKNSKGLEYDIGYENLNNFKKSKIMFNLSLLNERYNYIVDDIKDLINAYPNVTSITAKILNVNTLDETEINSKHSQWIIKNAIPKSDSNKIVEILSDNFEQAKGYDDFTDRYEWVYKGIPIILYARRADYGTANIVYYEGNLTDYHFNTLNFI